MTGIPRKVKCKCKLDSSTDSPGEGWNVLIFWWKWKINILTISRNTFSIFYWLEISKSFCFIETLKLKTLKCFEKCYFFNLVLKKNKSLFFGFFFKSALVHLLSKYHNSYMLPQLFPWFLSAKILGNEKFPSTTIFVLSAGLWIQMELIKKISCD